MYKVKIAKDVIRDIRNISLYIAQENPYRALSFAQELLDKAESILSLFPLSGKKSYQDYRLLVYKNYYIFYKVDEKKREVWLSKIANPANYSAYKGLIN